MWSWWWDRQTHKEYKCWTLKSKHKLASLNHESVQFEFTHFIFLCPPRFCLIHWQIPYCWRGYHILLESIFWLGNIYRFYSQKRFLRLKHCISINIMFIFMPIQIRNADLHERFSPLSPDHFWRTSYQIILIKYFITKKKTVSKIVSQNEQIGKFHTDKKCEPPS